MGHMSDTSFPNGQLDVVYILQKFKQNGRRLYCSYHLDSNVHIIYIGASRSFNRQLVSRAVTGDLDSYVPPLPLVLKKSSGVSMDSYRTVIKGQREQNTTKKLTIFQHRVQ